MSSPLDEGVAGGMISKSSGSLPTRSEIKINIMRAIARTPDIDADGEQVRPVAWRSLILALKPEIWDDREFVVTGSR